MAVIGINIGRVNSISCVFWDKGIEYIPNSFGEYHTPTAVGFDEEGRCIVGKEVIEMNYRNEQNVFFDFMESFGNNKKYYVYQDNIIKKEYRADELVSYIVKSIKVDAINYIGEENVCDVIISVPAYYSEEQRLALKQVVSNEGLRVIKIISIPLTIVLDNILKEGIANQNNQHVLVVDVGGKTVEVSLVQVFEDELMMVSSIHDDNLGGEIFNDIIEEEFYRFNNIDKDIVSSSVKKIVKNEAKLCKLELSNMDRSVRSIFVNNQKYLLTMDNQRLLQLSSSVFRKIEMMIKAILMEENVSIENVNRIILTGGACMMPVVKKNIINFFGDKVRQSRLSDKLVADGLGSAIVNEVLKQNRKYVTLSEMCPYSIGVELHNHKISTIIDRKEILPTSRIKYYNAVLDDEDKVSINIYKGDNYNISDNICLGRIEFDMADVFDSSEFAYVRETKEIELSIRFTYDFCGILDVDVRCVDNGKQIHKTIVNSNTGMSESQMLDLLHELEQIKVHPKYLDKNNNIIIRAKNVSSRLDVNKRSIVDEALDKFIKALDSEKKRWIRSEYEHLSLVLNMVESNNIYLE